VYTIFRAGTVPSIAKQNRRIATEGGFISNRYPFVKSIVDGGSKASRTLADKVCEDILKQIIGNKLPAGTPLTTVGIAQSFGVSRTPVAKAFGRLAADGILLQPNNHHAVVSAGASQWLDQCRRLRVLLEPEAAAAAAIRMDPQLLNDLWSLSREARPVNGFDWKEAAVFFDAALHLSIAESCANLPMKAAIRRCWTYKRLAYRMNPPSEAQLKRDFAEHLAILKCVAAGDSANARKTMARHLKSARIK
jgi:DNA-binding GntR family transcriptional regulator